MQLSELLFPFVIGAWLLAGMPGLRRAVGPAGAPAAVWVGANAATAAAAVWGGPAWRETAAFVYLGTLLVAGAAILADAGSLRRFLRWWTLVVGAVVAIGLAGWLVATLGTGENLLAQHGSDMLLLGNRVFRVRSTLAPTSKLLATLLIVALPAAFVFRRHGTPHERRVYGWLIGAMTLCELLTFSRQTLEFVGTLGLLAILESRRRRPALVAGLGTAYVIGFLAIQVLSTWRVTDLELTRAMDRSRVVTDQHYYATIPDLGVRTISVRLEYVHDNYFALKRIAWKQFLERPVTGWGPDTWAAIQKRAEQAGYVPTGFRFQSAQSEPLTVAAEMGLVGLVAPAVFWTLCLRAMWASSARGFAGMLARYQAIACGAVLLTSIHLDVMRFRFLWVSLALGIAARICAREECVT